MLPNFINLIVSDWLCADASAWDECGGLDALGLGRCRTVFLQSMSPRILKKYYNPSMSKSQQTPDKLIEFVLWPCLRSSGKVCMCNMSLSNRRRFYCLFALTFLPPKKADKNTALLRCATVIPWPCWKEGSAQDAGGTCSSTFGTQRYQAEALILVQQHDNMFRHVCDNDLYKTEVQEDLLLRQMPPIRLDLIFYEPRWSCGIHYQHKKLFHLSQLDNTLQTVQSQ